MPRVPTFEAGEFRRTAQARALTPVTNIAGALEDVGTRLTNIDERLREQQDTTNIASIIGRFEGSVKDVQREIGDDTPDFFMRDAEFHTRMRKVTDDLISEAQNSRVKAAIRAHMARWLPTHAATYAFANRELIAKKQIADLLPLEDTYAQLAAEAATPEQMNASIAIFTSLIDGRVKSNHLDVHAAAQWKERFREKVIVSRMNRMADSDWDAFKEAYDRGEFSTVPADKRAKIFRVAADRHDERVTKAYLALRRAMDVHRESVNREAAVRVIEGKMDVSFVQENAMWVDGTTILAWGKAIHDQQLGDAPFDGDPIVMRMFGAIINDPDIDPRVTFRQVTAAYAQRSIPWKLYGEWTRHLQGEINRRRSELRSERNEQEAREREFYNKLHSEGHGIIKEAFRTTSIVAIDTLATEVLTQVLTEYARRSRGSAGQEDPINLTRELIPRYMPLISNRVKDRIRINKTLLGTYSSKEQLNKDRARIGEAEWERLSGVLEDMIELQRYLNRTMEAVAAHKRLHPTE